MQHKRIKPVIRAVVCVVAFALVFCGKDYDPFVDLTNARAHVLSWTFSDRDSVPVYSTGSLVIGVALREHVDSFSLSAPRNRYWTDTTIRRESASSNEAIDAEAFSFAVSFYDTGKQTISIRTFRDNREAVTDNVFIRSVLPLRQSAVRGFFGDTMLLSTAPVTDKDVFYQWDFGSNRSVSSTANTEKAVFFGGVTSGTGTLRVTDLSGGHATPAYVFPYVMTDTAKPVILCINDSLRGDTLIIRDSVLAFKAYICEYGDKAVDSCKVNKSPFDIADPRSHVYVKIFRNITQYTRLAGPLAITVDAKDVGALLHESNRTFWAFFDPSGVSNPEARLSFIVPAKDSSRTAARTMRIFGLAENYRSDSMVIHMKVGDSAYPDARLVTGTSGTWEWSAHLDSFVNTITVSAYSTSSRLLASASVTVLYDSSAQDVIKPMIWDISANGKPAGNLYTPLSNIKLKVIAFDEGSGIQALTINGMAVTPDSSGYVWYAPIGPLAHVPSGTKVTISAVDRSQNEKDTSVTMFHNTPPVLVSSPAIPAVLCIDSGYTFHISWYDADADSIQLIRLHAPASMVLSPAGTVSWNPAAADTGFDSLVVQLFDGYEYSAPFSWKFECRNCSLPYAGPRFDLSWSYTGAVTPAGELDLSKSFRPETLSFVIDDKNNPLTEKYTVTISERSMNSIETLDKKSFVVIVGPDSTRVLDTIGVRVGDMAGTSGDSARFIVRYSGAWTGPYAAWGYFKTLYLNTTASGANVNGNVYGFPVHVRLTPGNFNFARAKKNGQDVRFSTPGGIVCPYEIERWDSAGGVAELWVKVDTVYGNDSSHSIVMFSGNSAATDASNSSAVFDSAQNGYGGVWHMNETPDSAYELDASACKRNAKRMGAPGFPLQVPGLVGVAAELNGSTDWIDIGQNQSIINGLSQVTISAWIRPDSLSVAGIIEISTNSGGASGGSSRAAMEIGANGELVCIARSPDDQTNIPTLASSTTMSKGNDYFVACIIKYDSDQIDLYINGQLAGGGTVTFGQTQTDNTNSAYAAIGSDDNGVGVPFKGLIGEVEVTRSARSADWLKLCYMNQKAVDALVIFK